MNKKHTDAEPEDPPNVGEQLREARLASGRDIKDLSRELHINLAHLHALEDNRFEDLAGDTFAKGYIRAYARALGLEPEALVKSYQQLGTFRDKPIPSSYPVDDRVNKLGLIILSALIATVLIALFVIWFLGSGYRSQPDSADNTPEVDSASGNVFQAQPAESPQTSLPATDSPAQLEDNIDSPDTSSELAPDSLVIPESDAVPATPAGETEQQGDGPAAGMTEDLAQASPSPVDQQVPDDSGSGVQAAGNPPGDGPDKLKVVLSQDSWIEVNDAKGARSLHGLYKGGDSRLISGAAPFQVFLGNAPGVRLELNEQAFDMSDYIRDNKTARFALVKP